MKKFDPKDLAKVPPVPCKYGLGDTVWFTNEFGIVFGPYKVIGFDVDTSFYGQFIYLDKVSNWFPVSPESLSDKDPRKT